MTLGLVGRKRGMTRVFTEEGDSIPVTVIEVEPNRVTQVKTPESDGYSAVQVASGQRKANRVSKSLRGHAGKAGVEPGRVYREFRLDQVPGEGVKPGAEIKLDSFEVGQKVDVAGISKGKGFAGVIKRHHFSSQDATHGNSLSHRAPGSIGQNQTPGRVFKGKRMAGHLGNVARTAMNVEVVRVDADRNLILIKGAVPGAPGTSVIVRPAARGKKKAG